MSNKYHVGDNIAVTATAINHLGSPAIPSIVVFAFKNPSGVIATQAGSTVASGVYFGMATLDLAGDWFCRIQGIGVNPFAEEFSFHVRASLV